MNTDDYLAFRQQYLGGVPIERMSPTQAKVGAEYLMEQFGQAYTDPKHSQHRFVSEDVRRLHERAVAGQPESERPL